MEVNRILTCGLTQDMTPYLQSCRLCQARNAELLLLSQGPVLPQVQHCDCVLPSHRRSNL